MKLKINGIEKDLNVDRFTVSEILKSENVTNFNVVTVQVNGNIIKKNEYESTYLRDGDEVEFLYFIGGGSK